MAKQSTNLNLIPEVLDRGGYVLSCAPVSKILTSGRRATGVRGRFSHPLTRQRGARFEVRARGWRLGRAPTTGARPC